jgi:hypothetical protein
MPKSRKTDEMAPEYDFSNGVCGKYADRFASGSNIAIIDKDLTALFPDSDSVNRTLRLVARLRDVSIKVSPCGKSSKVAG